VSFKEALTSCGGSALGFHSGLPKSLKGSSPMILGAWLVLSGIKKVFDMILEYIMNVPEDN